MNYSLFSSISGFCVLVEYIGFPCPLSEVDWTSQDKGIEPNDCVSNIHFVVVGLKELSVFFALNRKAIILPDLYINAEP
mgnify:CR=1 FL=1